MHRFFIYGADLGAISKLLSAYVYKVKTYKGKNGKGVVRDRPGSLATVRDSAARQTPTSRQPCQNHLQPSDFRESRRSFHVTPTNLLPLLHSRDPHQTLPRAAGWVRSCPTGKLFVDQLWPIDRGLASPNKEGLRLINFIINNFNGWLSTLFRFIVEVIGCGKCGVNLKGLSVLIRELI